MKTKILSGLLCLCLGFSFASCSDEENYSSSTTAVITEISTGEATATAVSATVTGKVKDLTKLSSSSYQVGVVYGLTDNLENEGTKQVGSIDAEGNVTATLSNLTKGCRYAYATYVTLQGKYTMIGDVKYFTATDANVVTLDATDVSACKAKIGGQISGVKGAEEATSVSIQWALDSTALESDPHVFEFDDVPDKFIYCIEGLLPNTTYCYRAVSTVGDVICYGEMKYFTTTGQEMEYVDLGLSKLWAKCNIGAEEETEMGAHVGYGDKLFFNYSTNVAEYTPWDIAGSADDDCLANLHIDGSATMKSSMPTIDEIKELISKTTQNYEVVDGVDGIRFTAKNGNSIFLPFAGYREGSTLTGAGEGYYWTGNINELNEVYAKNLKLTVDGAEEGVSALFLGLSIRSVRAEEPVAEGITIRNYNGVQGDIEGNGNYRYDIYNQWDGSNTGSEETSALVPSEVKFSESLTVKFAVSGIGSTECDAYMVFADGTWATQNWGYNDSGEASVHITGDGTYSMTIHGAGSGLGVFAIDFKGLSAAVGAENINVKLLTCTLDDWGTKLDFDNAKLVCGDIEGNGNYRADIYNQWDGSNTGSQETCGVDISAVAFSNRIGVTFAISGIGSTECDAYMVFADGTWATQNWGYNDSGAGSVHITGDGTYTMSLTGAGSGFGVFAIDFKGLTSAMGDQAGSIKVRIANIRVE